MRCDYPHGIGEVTEAQRNQPKLTSSKVVAELGLEPGWSDSEQLLSLGASPRGNESLSPLCAHADSALDLGGLQ